MENGEGTRGGVALVEKGRKKGRIFYRGERIFGGPEKKKKKVVSK